MPWSTTPPASRMASMKVNMRTAGRRQVLDDEHARALRHHALDLRIAAVALRLLADIDHRQPEPVGQKGCERDAGRLAAGDARRTARKPASRRSVAAAKSITAERMRG